MQILLIDEAVSVLVDHIKGLFKLLDLRLVEHGEDIGRGSLWTLLRRLSFGAFGCRHSDRWFVSDQCAGNGREREWIVLSGWAEGTFV